MTVRIRYDQWNKTFDINEKPLVERLQAYRRLPSLLRLLLRLLRPLYSPLITYKWITLQCHLLLRALKRVRLPSAGIIAWDAFRLSFLLTIIIISDVLLGRVLDAVVGGLRGSGGGGSSLTSRLSNLLHKLWGLVDALGEMDLEARVLQELSDANIQRTSDLLLDTIR